MAEYRDRVRSFIIKNFLFDDIMINIKVISKAKYAPLEYVNNIEIVVKDINNSSINR